MNSHLQPPTTRRPSRPKTPKTKATSTPVLVDVTPTKPTLVLDDIINTHSETPGKDSGHNITIIISGVIVVLLLLILGGVIYWKHRGQRRGQTETGDGQTGQRTQQEEQNESDVLYTAVNSQTKHNKAEEMDDVTYSSVVHSNTVRAAHTPVALDDSTVYASIKTN